jgi:DnaJ-class molecular chaperone
MDNQDLHQHLAILELKPGASFEEIRVSYREMVQILHPDRFHGNLKLQQRTHLKLQQVNEAYEVLKDYCENNGHQTPMDNPRDARQQSDTQRSTSNVLGQVISVLNQVPGMNQAHSRDFNRASPKFELCDGSVVKTWKNPVGVDHVFIADKSGNMMFGGLVGWIHSDGLMETIAQIHRDFT